MPKLLFVSLVSASFVIAGCSGQYEPGKANEINTEATANMIDAMSAGTQISTAVGFQQDSEIELDSANYFAEKIKPLLEEFCINCHSPGNMKELDFLTAMTEADVAEMREVYATVVEQMETHMMPPGKSDKPTEVEIALVTGWIKKSLDLKPAEYDRISTYVVSTFEDSSGNLWFGTIANGAARYDGKSLIYLSTDDGLPSTTVTSFAEDRDGNVWLGTRRGVCKYDGQTVSRLGSEEGLPTGEGRVKADRNGNIWASTNSGVFRFDGTTFSKFDLPSVEKKPLTYAIAAGRASMQLEDKEGNLWFATDGHGAIKFNGKSFTQFTKEDGLCTNNVTSIIEDQKGNIWFTCMQSYQPEMTGDGGVCRYDGSAFTKFPEVKGLAENDIHTIYETKSGDIWIGALHVGVYRYDGETFTLFSETNRKLWTRNFGLQSMVEDNNGLLWFGFSGGLFRFDGESFFNVTKKGPWN